MSGEAPYTGQFMGGIHPRVKKIVGTRLAKAARAIAYGDKKQIWSGPILESCVVQGGSIQLTFQEDKLLDDTIMVLQDTVSQVDVGGAWQWTPDMLQLVSQMMPQSPMEVQLNGNTTGTLDDGVWVPVGLHPKCNPTGRDSPSPGQGECSLNTTTGAKLPGWNIVTVDVGSFRNAMANITGIRYAWSENPCCPNVNRGMIPCPPNSCPIQTFNSTLPAVPFWATIVGSKCEWISTHGPPKQRD